MRNFLIPILLNIFHLTKMSLQHFGTSFTFNNRYNKILKYLGLAQGFSVDEQAFVQKKYDIQ